MATDNQVDLSLFGETGTGSFLGATNGSFTLAKNNNMSVGLSGTTFTLNGRCGIITIDLSGILNNAFGTWTWNNTSITTSSLIFFSAMYTNLNVEDWRMCAVPTLAGRATLRGYNYSGSSGSGSFPFRYMIF